MRSVTLLTLSFGLCSALVQAGSCSVSNGLPKCARKCFKAAQNSTASCSGTRIDLACLCSQASVAADISSCLDSACNTVDLQPAAEYGKALCAAAAANGTASTSPSGAISASSAIISASASASASATVSGSAEGTMTTLPIADENYALPSVSASASFSDWMGEASASASPSASWSWSESASWSEYASWSDYASASASASPSASPSSDLLADAIAPPAVSSSTTNRLTMPTVALAQAQNLPVTTITTTGSPSATPSGTSEDIAGSTGGAGRISQPAWLTLGLAGVITMLAI
ncbi:hypothetical protein BD324DRAFT_631121 [Kockovaella imperatae]|uniref:CFEM domain-containing protein n=1 Tax=Kockovaella imperatae TaxID=4999 RepID=A0A1Y1UCF5_9TREE|nr:hypothetical protein BD324DRAFT_631121 [Kockovaella imperatae]ORX35682.1 hypothetical protein BD324DRAFT_631121 [Kockovaella imperatae]